MKIRKVFYSLLFFLLLIKPVTASSAIDNVRETVIENGVSVFALEDYSSPLIRVEVCVRAGFSSQTQQNAGFAKLLTDLIEKSSKLKFQSVECGSDSIRFVLNISPSDIHETLFELSENIFNPVFSDSLLKSQLAITKRQVLLNADDAGTLINSGIDARIFKAEPWRNDSGIYPALFAKISENDARKILNDFHDAYFVPGNTAVFISGNADFDFVMENIQKTFGRFYSNKKVSFRPLAVSPVIGTAKNKFVIHSKDFSEELTQVVFQYGSFSEPENIISSLVFNNDYSDIKQKLCFESSLNIPGPEYVNIASASKSGSSRLVIQSLLQNVDGITPLQQVSDFLDIVRNNCQISYADFETALTGLHFNFNKTISSSTKFMEELCGVWAQLPYDIFVDAQTLSDHMKNKLSDIENVDAEIVTEKLSRSEPFTFVILNTKQFNKYKSQFNDEGYEEISLKNSSWYTDSLYKNVKSLMEFSRKQATKGEIQVPDFVQDYIKNSQGSIKEYTLSNGIPLIFKRNKNTTGVTFLISIDGGSLRTAEDNGFEEVMTNILTMNILRQIKLRQKDGLILNDFEINSETNLTSSRIIVECDSEDLYSVVNALYSSLIMDEVIPSDADRIVSGRRTRKRLENGSTSNQLLCAAVQNLISDRNYSKIYEAKNEILENTTYDKILEYYPGVLDASRYTIVVSGNLEPENYIQMMDDAFGQLQLIKPVRSVEVKAASGIENFPFGKQKKVKLVHTFLTDIPAKDAGPMPQILVPTKSFSDPVLYCVYSEPEKKNALNALMCYMEKEMTAAASERNYLQNCKINVLSYKSNLPFGAFAFSSVERSSAADNLYKEVWKKLKGELSNSSTTIKTLNKIKTAFVENNYSEAHSNTGAALLLYEGIVEGLKPENYLDVYSDVNALNAEELLDVLENSLAFDKLFRLYSDEARN